MDSLRGQPNPESRVRAEHIDRSRTKGRLPKQYHPLLEKEKHLFFFHSFIHSFIYFAFINYSTKVKLIIIHLAGSPGSYFAYLKDCLKKRSKKLECKLSVAEQKY